MVQAPDAASVLGEDIDTGGVQEVAAQRYEHGVAERMPRDFATMYHPDGSTSVILLPPLGKTGKNVADRRQKILHYIMNKRGPTGEQWWFAKPPPGWVPQPLPYRCPVEGCTRRGGLPHLRAVWMHIRHKHPEETILYQGILSSIEKQLQEQVAPDFLKVLGRDVPASEVPEPDKDVLAEAAVDAAPAGTELAEYTCECGKDYADRKNPKLSLGAHKRLHCPLRKEKE